jgi:hypothetical protein
MRTECELRIRRTLAAPKRGCYVFCDVANGIERSERVRDSKQVTVLEGINDCVSGNESAE